MDFFKTRLTEANDLYFSNYTSSVVFLVERLQVTLQLPVGLSFNQEFLLVLFLSLDIVPLPTSCPTLFAFFFSRFDV